MTHGCVLNWGPGRFLVEGRIDSPRWKTDDPGKTIKIWAKVFIKMELRTFGTSCHHHHHHQSHCYHHCQHHHYASAVAAVNHQPNPHGYPALSCNRCILFLARTVYTSQKIHKGFEERSESWPLMDVYNKEIYVHYHASTLIVSLEDPSDIFWSATSTHPEGYK